MITVSAKTPKVSTNPLMLAGQKSPQESGDNFAQLLLALAKETPGLALPKELSLALQDADDKDAPNLAQEVSGKKDSKKKDLLSLLKNDKDQKANIVINPQISELMSTKDLKTIIKGAKEYLKDKIKESLEYKKGQIKELPKTVKGLVKLAQKIGVDIEKITLESVQEKNLPKTNIPTKSIQEFHTKDGGVAKVITTKDVEEEISKDGKTKTKTTQETKEIHVVKKDRSSQKSEITTHISKLIQTTSKSSETHPDPSQKQQPVQNVQQNSAQNTQQIEKLPLFKELSDTLASHSTAELVDKKVSKEHKKTSKSDDTLKALLHGTKHTQKEPMTLEKADALLSSKAPHEIQHKNHSSVLSALLHGNEHKQQDDTQNQSQLFTTKEHTHSHLHVKSADDLGVKIHEAKQMVKYLAQDIKHAIEEYKPPFTRIKVKLNPQKLGEVDLTVVQRGKNLHVNISSNQTAIHTLAQNAGDLKTQLNQNGMNNATLNFNSQSDQQNQQQQNNQQRKNAKKAYDYFDSDESNEEVLSSLEIVVPRYI